MQILSKVHFLARSSAFLLVIYLLPFTFVLWFVTTFGVNIPYQDQWELVSLFQRIADGKATFQDFFVQHNEHRILFPKLIISVLAFVSSWNIQWELYLNILLAAIVFLLLYKISFDQTVQHNRSFHLANISTCFIVFSVGQWENWLWGFQIAWFFMNVCLAIAILVLSVRLNLALWVRLTVAALACIVATFSSAHGLLVWIAVIPSLIICCKDYRQLRKVGLIWIFLFITACYLYLIDYHKPSGHPSLLSFLEKPFLSLEYFLTLLGSPLVRRSNFSAEVGLAILLNFIFFVIFYFKQAGSRFSKDAAPWISLGCFTILFALMTTVGRSGFGVEQASASRYVTVAILLVIALVQLWRLALTKTKNGVENWLDSPTQSSSGLKLRFASIKPLIGSILTLLVLINSINSIPSATDFRSRLLHGQACLEIADYIVRSPENCLQLIYPDANTVSDRAKVLNQIGFRHFPKKPIEFLTSPDQVHGYIDSPPTSQTPAVVKRSCINCEAVAVNGWAILPKQVQPARLVLLSHRKNPEHDPDAFFANVYVRLPSPDIAKARRTNRYARSRWEVSFSPELLPPGELVLTAWAYEPNDKQFIKLNGEPKLKVE
ncbi:MAG: hypothetical protein DCF22_02535 [Leptolyngbya sp.]|nr:MAG: hypothetical protein DCF22_02535 [Leptolyngbya sp.]